MSSKNLVVSELSLCIADSESPFALTGQEKYLGPDDWAWQFLRLNHSYQREYADAASNNDPDNVNLLGAVAPAEKHSDRKIRYNEALCRKRFGLSTWLDPKCFRLPKLARGESWFSPLTQCWDSPEVPRVVYTPSLFSFKKHPFIGAYDRAMAKRAGVKVQAYSSPLVWYAVDCSVPPAAQLKSVEAISKMHRDWLGKQDAEMRPRVKDVAVVVPLKDSPWFQSESFDTASGAADESEVHASELWYAIQIDTLGPIKEQVEDRLGLLNQAYIRLCSTDLATPPIRTRFRHELTGPGDGNGGRLSDGNFLKALVLCAQLSQRGLNADQTTSFLRQNSTSSADALPKIGGARDDWASGLELRVANYTENARKFVKGGYRWLVHAQKPQFRATRPGFRL